jgi:phosphatidate cytidylyltransferase
MLKQRVITAIILAVCLLAAMFAAPTMLWQLLVLAIAWQSGVEWARLSGLKGWVAMAYCLFILLAMVGLLWFDATMKAEWQTYLHLAGYALAVLLWVFVVPAWLITGWRPQMPWFMAIVGTLVILPTTMAMLDLRAYNPWALLFAMSMVWIADIAAYFTGRRFGKTKLAPAISPGKTWEGVYGALVAVTIYILVCWAAGLFSAFQNFFPGMIVAGCWWVGLAVIGDLFESAIKRQAGVKDSGTLLPGHGGLLDRIDALTSTLPFAGLALMLQRLA